MPGTPPRPTTTSLRIRVAPEDLVWQIWGLRDLGWFGWLNLLLAAVVGYGVGWLTGWPAAGAGVFVVLLLTLWRFWLPMRVELTSQGISQTVLGRTRRIPWTAVRNYQVRTRGVLLFPDLVLTPLSPLRGLYLPWGLHKEQVLSHVEYYLNTWTQAERSTGQG